LGSSLHSFFYTCYTLLFTAGYFIKPISVRLNLIIYRRLFF